MKKKQRFTWQYGPSLQIVAELKRTLMSTASRSHNNEYYCSVCKLPLNNQPCMIKNDQIYCASCGL
ncbi:LIM domain-containing protein [Bacillus sp. CRN 9]|uniref:LIM domain-containing protein n=1 Tax=Cytobacillus horneckiae TaxID=549687 RepID=UPI00156202AE|nr:hypothetical protein [Bacillus sp. CRN 9]